MKHIFLLFIFLFFCQHIWSQTLPVGGINEQQLRMRQLLGEVPLSSFSVRPIIAGIMNDADSIARVDGYTPKIVPLSFFNGKGLLKLLPITWDQQFNSHHTFGWNDGSMIPSKGYQTRLSAGVFAKIGILSVQLQPEFVYAANASFDGFALGKNDAEFQKYYDFYNYIDDPERFGNKAYSKAFWGQSSIRLNFGPASVGFSTENIWWGPGRENALLMSNNAPGFKHVTINTTQPVHTPIGAFEGQLIGGWLDQSGFSPLNQIKNTFGVNLFIPRNPEQRYLSGLNINYQPKWVPGLTLGFIRTFMAYKSDIKTFADYVPFFVKLQKKTVDQDTYPRDQRISMYVRWLFQQAHAEVYFEYGLNDNAFNFRDFIGSPDHARSYLFGMTKLVPLNGRTNEYIQVNAEITQMSQSVDRTVRPSGGFYHHGGVTQGYTQLGQVLGAGSGTGGNLQSFQVSWIKGYKKLGMGFERLEHDMDFYDLNIGNLNGLSRKWVDLALSANGQWDYKNFIVRAKVQGIQSLNYQWLLKDYTPGVYYVPHNDVFNFHGEVGVTYRF